MRVHLNHVLVVGGMAIVSLQSQLLALIAQWRGYAESNADHLAFNLANNNITGEEGIVAYRDCADELEALLQPATPVQEPKLGVCPECGGTPGPDYLGAYCTECGAKKS
jgi:hypothetical protein